MRGTLSRYVFRLLALTIPQGGAVGARRLDISYPTTEFTKLVKMWEKFDEASMGIVVRHIKRFLSTTLICQCAK